jgi:multidrug efflux pump subunit AcrA (membrane-fusion protein)
LEHAPQLRPRTPLNLQTNAVRGFKPSPFELIALFIVLLATAFGAYVVYAKTTNLNATPATTSSAYIPAFRSNLTSTISTNGTVQATQQVSLSFGSSGEIKAINVKVGDQVTAGQVLAKLDDTQLQSSLRSAQTNLASAQARLNATINPTAGDLATAQSSVLNAQNQIATAQKNLDDLRAKPTASDIATAQQGVLQAQNGLQSANDAIEKAQSDVENAQVALSDAQDAYDTCQTHPHPTNDPNCTTAKSNVAKAQSAYDAALNAVSNGNLDRSLQSAQLGLQVAMQKQQDALAGATATDLANAQNTLTSAQASLIVAQQKQNDLLNPKPETVLPLQSSVDSASDTAETAKKNLEKATITAPFDATISAVNGTVGGQASAGSTTSTTSAASSVITLLNPKLIRIDASVDQTDVTKLKPGQTATVTFDALSGNTYRATVGAVGLTPTTSSGVVTYTVQFALDTSVLPATTPVPAPGMTAQITVTTSSAPNAIVVPSRSIRGSGAAATVTVKGANGDEQRRVTTGLTNGTLTQISAGLNEGEEVLYTAPTATTGTTTAPQQQGQFTIPGGGAGGFQGGGAGGLGR